MRLPLQEKHLPVIDIVLTIVLRQAGGIVSLLSAFCLYALAMFTVELALFAGIGAG